MEIVETSVEVNTVTLSYGLDSHPPVQAKTI
jgi:hypothetical protein